MMALRTGLVALVLPALLSGQDLAPPTRVQAGGQDIDVDVGHAAPFVGDLDGDGVPELLVGQYGAGQLRIYKNTGTRKNPRFDRFTWFEAGGEVARIWTN